MTLKSNPSLKFVRNNDNQTNTFFLSDAAGHIHIPSGVFKLEEWSHLGVILDARRGDIHVFADGELINTYNRFLDLSSVTGSFLGISHRLVKLAVLYCCSTIANIMFGFLIIYIYMIS